MTGDRRRRNPAARFAVTAAVTAVMVLALAWGARVAIEKAEKAVYPLRFTEQVERYSALYGVPREVLYAVIKTESSFSAEAKSSAGAVGLMQIKPETFWWLMSKTGEQLGDEMLTDPETNIRYGAFFLSMLYGEFGVWQTAYAAYNAGPTRVREWLSDGTVSLDGEKLCGIPIDETASYVNKVSSAAEKYIKLYGEGVSADAD